MSTGHVEFAEELRAGIKTVLGTTVTYNAVSYPVYRNIPKPPALTYVKIGQVLHNEDGNKDEFVYYGTIYIHVIDESQLRPTKEIASGIQAVVRAALKTSVTNVPTLANRTVISFTPGISDEQMDQTESGTRIQLTDTYDFIIE